MIYVPPACPLCHEQIAIRDLVISAAHGRLYLVHGLYRARAVSTWGSCYPYIPYPYYHKDCWLPEFAPLIPSAQEYFAYAKCKREIELEVDDCVYV